MAISPQRLTIYLYSAHRAVIFVIAQLSCLVITMNWFIASWDHGICIYQRHIPKSWITWFRGLFPPSLTLTASSDQVNSDPVVAPRKWPERKPQLYCIRRISKSTVSATAKMCISSLVSRPSSTFLPALSCFACIFSPTSICNSFHWFILFPDDMSCLMCIICAF